MTYSRPAMTYTPDIVLDENGQEHYGDSGTVVIGTTASTIDPNYQENTETGELEMVEEVDAPEDIDSPDYVPYEVRLADTQEEVLTSDYEVDLEMANTIASVDLGRSPEAITVKHLASKVYQGSMSPEEAFQEAINTGINPDKLMKTYYQLKSHFE